jgi:hypothetical protein
MVAGLQALWFKSQPRDNCSTESAGEKGEREIYYVRDYESERKEKTG